MAEGYGFAIPTGATITNIQINIWRTCPACIARQYIVDNALELIIGGSLAGVNYANTTTQWPATDTEASYSIGSGFPTVAQINASTFGVALSANNHHVSGSALSETADVDAIQLVITYTITTSYTQGSYRVFGNADSAEPAGSTWLPGTGSAGWAGGGRVDMGTAYFNGKLWAMGGNNASTYYNDVYCSADGATWSDTNCGTTSAGWSGRSGMQVLVYQGKLWVLGGFNGTTYYHDVWCSSDGVIWSDATCGTSAAPWTTREFLGATVFNNVMWVMGGDNANVASHDVWYSSDGTNWTETTAAAGWASRWGMQALTMNGKLWVMGGTDNTNYYNDVWCSSDGVTWSDTSCGTTSAAWSGRAHYGAAVFGNELWLFDGNASPSIYNDAWYSADGKTWTQASAAPGSATRTQVGAISTGQQLWAIGGASGGTYAQDTYSTSMPSLAASSPLAAANTAATVPGAGQTFRLRLNVEVANAPASQNAQSFELGYAALSGGSCAATTGYLPVTTTTPVSYASNTIAAEGQAISYTSGTDPADSGMTPTPQEYLESGTTSFSNPSAVSVGGEGLWDFALTTHNATAGGHYCIAMLDSLGSNLNGGYNNYPEIIIQSATASQSSYRFYAPKDATTTAATSWTTPASGTNYASALGRAAAAAVTYSGQMWMFGGDNGGTVRYNDDWFSSDGSNWTQKMTNCSTGCPATQWSQRDGPQALAFNSKMWILGGQDNSSVTLNDVWCSTDGLSWNDSTCGTASAPWQGRSTFGAVVFNNKMWVLGGFNQINGDLSDVWSSSDGTNWTEATASAPWGTRQDFSAVVYNNKMWVMGGFQSQTNQYNNDVWYSSDGISWTQATASTSWDARTSAAAAVQDNRMWIMGGFDPTTHLYAGDAWSSADGVNWTQGPTITTGRTSLSALSFNNSLWALGGKGQITLTNDDQYLTTGGVDVGSAWANQNTALDLTKYDSVNGNMMSASPTPFRLRWDMNISGGQEPLSTSTSTGLVLNLQYAEMVGGSCTATASSGTWANVGTYGSATPIQFYTAYPNASNHAPVVPNANDPTDGSNATIYQTFNNANSFSNSVAAVDGGQDGLFDFSLAVAASVPHSSYCLRAVNFTGGTAIAATNYPQINLGPTMSKELLRGREWWNSSGVREFKDIK
ncbi:MAG TPA: hypothetical protein VGH44_03685 [Candidatus Saccharimonadia bacterium]|jgi:hypothetical protein